MPQRVLTEQEFNAIRDKLLDAAPAGMSEEHFNIWFKPRFDGAVAEAENNPQPVQGSALRRLVMNFGAMVNPVTMVKGVAQAVTHPLDTTEALLAAQGEQFSKATQAFGEGRYAEAAGHGVAGVVPLVGPAAADVGEQIGQGDVAGGVGAGGGLVASIAGARPAVQAVVKGARTVPAVANKVAGALERGATSRVVDIMAPKVGPNKTRFGNQAQEVAPRVAQDLTSQGAPFTRERFHARVGEQLATAEQGLDAAADARLAATPFETTPLIEALLKKRQALTSEAVKGSRAQPERVVEFQNGVPNAYNKARPLGADVVPSPNAARVAVIDRAIEELQQLGPVTQYDPIRVMRQAYDGPAKAIYSPAVTADYMKAQGGKLGAADVTGVLREHLAQWDPKTAAANAEYHIYRSMDDVLSATAEVERTRPRVGRQIMARLTGVLGGGQAGGPIGAAVGYAGAPIVESALASGLTTKLATARLMTQLANAIRSGNVQAVDSLTAKLRRVAVPAGVQTGRVTSPSESRTRNTAPVMP